MMKKNYVLYILVVFVGVVSLNGCYHGAYSGKAPNSVYRGDNQGTPGLRVQPMEFGLTQAQMEAMSPEEFDAYMDKLDRYNESMERASRAEGYDAAAKSGWTRYRISPTADPSSAPSPSERRALRRAELAAQRSQTLSGVAQNGGQQESFAMPPKPKRADFSGNEQGYRQALKQWYQLGKDLSGR
jgi:hypothetical protein